MSRKEVVTYSDDFIGAQSMQTSAGDGPWVVTDVSSSGTPTYIGDDSENSGAITITLDGSSEAESVRIHHNDIKSFDIDKIQTVRYIVKIAAFSAVSTIVFGVAGDTNATLDSIAQCAWFRMQGSDSQTAVVVETDDGTVVNRDVATSQTLAAVYKTFEISFVNGTDDVRFYMDNGDGQLRRVAASTTFDMSNFTGNLQPYFGLDKASGTTVDTITIDLVEITYER